MENHAKSKPIGKKNKKTEKDDQKMDDKNGNDPPPLFFNLVNCTCLATNFW